MRLRSALPAAVLLLAACAGGPPKSSLPEEPPRLSLVGRGVPALAPEAVNAALEQQRVGLAKALSDADILQPAADGALRVRLDPDDSFERGAAQLQAAALAAYAEAATVLLSMESSVIHVLAYGPAGDADPAATLAARRAASVMDYLVRRGVPPTRLRAEGRVAADGDERLELVLQPVVRGREAQAWVPPADG